MYCLVVLFSFSDCDDILNVSASPRSYSGCTEELHPTCCSVRSGRGGMEKRRQGTFWMKKSGFSKIPQDRTHPKCFATIWRNSDENGLALKLTGWILVSKMTWFGRKPWLIYMTGFDRVIGSLTLHCLGWKSCELWWTGWKLGYYFGTTAATAMFSIPFFQPFGGCRLFEPCYEHTINNPWTKKCLKLKTRSLFFKYWTFNPKRLGWRCNHSDCCIIFRSTTWIVTTETARGLWQPRLHQQLFEMLFEPSGAGLPWLLDLRGWFFFCVLKSFQAFLPESLESGNATLEVGQLILTSPLKFSNSTPEK